MRSHSLFAAALLVLMLPAIPTVHAQQPNQIPPKFSTVYPPPGQAQQDLQKAMQTAAEQHKRIIVNFGNSESPNCQVLAEFFQNYINAKQVSEHFVVVPVDVGKNADQNRDLAQRFSVNPAGGVPVLVVLDPGGQVLTRDDEFRLARNMSANDLTLFLNKWRQQ